MSRTTVALLALLFVAATTTTTCVLGYQHADGEQFDVIGARIVTCAGCRLNSLPRVRNFLENEARSYPALTVDYHFGKDPELQFLDKHRRVVSTHDLAPLSALQIAQLLNNNNIHTWTPAPNYLPPEFHTTKHCIAFRQTGECSPTGPREPEGDLPCLALVEESRSGFCQCSGGVKNVELVCGHDADTCDRLCDPTGEGAEEHTVPKPPSDSDL